MVEGFSLSVAVRTVNEARGDMNIMAFIRESKSPTNITVFLEDTAAVLGMAVALVGNIDGRNHGKPSRYGFSAFLKKWMSFFCGQMRIKM